jgi:hypothetical protein
MKSINRLGWWPASGPSARCRGERVGTRRVGAGDVDRPAQAPLDRQVAKPGTGFQKPYGDP